MLCRTQALIYLPLTINLVNTLRELKISPPEKVAVISVSVFTKFQITKSLEWLFCVYNFSASRPVLLILPLKIAEISNLPHQHSKFFFSLRRKCCGALIRVGGALIFLEFSKSTYFGGALIIFGKSSETSGVR